MFMSGYSDHNNLNKDLLIQKTTAQFYYIHASAVILVSLPVMIGVPLSGMMPNHWIRKQGNITDL